MLSRCGVAVIMIKLFARAFKSGYCLKKYSICDILTTRDIIIIKHGCDISRILIGYVLSDARFDWLVGNMSVCYENLLESKSEKNSIFLHLLRNIL